MRSCWDHGREGEEYQASLAAHKQQYLVELSCAASLFQGSCKLEKAGKSVIWVQPGDDHTQGRGWRISERHCVYVMRFHRVSIQC